MMVTLRVDSGGLRWSSLAKGLVVSSHDVRKQACPLTGRAGQPSASATESYYLIVILPFVACRYWWATLLTTPQLGLIRQICFSQTYSIMRVNALYNTDVLDCIYTGIFAL